MRNRSLDSTTPPEAADCWVYTVTEKGLRASGAVTMQAAAASLRDTAAELEKAAERLNQEVPAAPNNSGGTPLQVDRRGTVCGRYRHETRVPDLRLCGKWLGRAGFELGQKYQVNGGEGLLTIRAE